MNETSNHQLSVELEDDEYDRQYEIYLEERFGRYGY